MKSNKYKYKQLKHNSFKMFSYSIKEPWFSLIKLGLKTIEGRKNKGNFATMKIGDMIEWNNSDFGQRKIVTKVVGKREYSTFKEYLEHETLEKCLPGMDSIDDGLLVYFSYFTKEEEQTYGVVAIELELINDTT